MSSRHGLYVFPTKKILHVLIAALCISNTLAIKLNSVFLAIMPYSTIGKTSF